MNNATLLAISHDTEWLQTVIKVVDAHKGWTTKGATKDEEAIEKSCQCAFDLVLLAQDIPEPESKKLRKVLSRLNPEALIMQHSGEGKGLLSNTIREAMEQWNAISRPAVNILDDPLKNAAFNIAIQ